MISQNPAAGSSVAEGTSVSLVISTGPAMVTVPNVVGMTQLAAQSAITGAKLVVGTITQANSATVPVGDVISQNPAAGSSVAEGTSVSLVISTGPAMVTVPNVVGMTQAAAQSAINAANLSVGTITTANSSTVPAGNVISQDPAAGSSVSQGSSVNIVVSLGPVMITVPTVVGMTQGAAQSAIVAAGLVVGTVTSDYHDTIPPGSVISQTPAGGSSAAQGSSVNLVISLGPSGLPPDPSLVAPPLDLTIATTLYDASAFLYTGSNPIQTGVAPTTIEAKRAAVVRGKVLNRNGTPLLGVTITILNHPEYGQTLSRADGVFDLVVNGGGPLTIDYSKNDFLGAQRQLDIPWQDYVWLPDVILIPLDTQVTTINLATPSLQVARGTVQSDTDGNRQATLLFPQGTTAQMVMPDGSTPSMATLTIRATEYTVGPNGPQAMPAELPPNVGYTYCVEISADEALQAGAIGVQLNHPLYFYVEHFLGFPTGTIVPVGYYDGIKGEWVASDNGLVIKIVSVTNNKADLDVDKTAGADPSLYTSLGITDAERQQLASLYQVGQSLWRIPITHFSTVDANYPTGPTAGATGPGQFPPDQNDPPCETCKHQGSIIDAQSQVLGQEIPVVGTPFSLSYRSDRTMGRKEAFTLKIPLSGSTLPPGLQRIELEVHIAGRLFTWSFAPALNLDSTFVWDGKDAYGRFVQGKTPVLVRTGYSYRAVYTDPPPGSAIFAQYPWGTGMTVNSRIEVVLWQNWNGFLGTLLAKELGLGGWSLNPHHAYHRASNALYLGDGEEYTAKSIRTLVMDPLAGYPFATNCNTPTDPCGDGGPALAATIADAVDVAVGPDGSIYIAQDTYDPLLHYPHRIRKVDPSGIITTVVGTGERCTSPSVDCGDGGPATAAKLDMGLSIALGPDGSIYIAEWYNNRIRKVDPLGKIQTIVGNGTSTCSPDGTMAKVAAILHPKGVAVAPDGSLYFVTSCGGGGMLHRVNPGPNPTIVQVTGNTNYPGNGGPARNARLNSPQSVAIGPDGSLYVAESSNPRIRRIGTDGIITTVAGNGTGGLGGDGGPAVNAQMYGPKGIAVAPNGGLYIADVCNGGIRYVNTDGIITTVAGGGNTLYGYNTHGLPATQANLGTCYWYEGYYRIAMAPDGSVYLMDGEYVFRIHPAVGGLEVGQDMVPSKDGSEMYIFDAAGRHLQTLDTLTRSTRYLFTYDGSGHLYQVVDAYGNTTTIERGAGNPTAIVGPYGHRTEISLDQSGYLASLRDPAGNTTALTYTPDGLMTGLTDPNNNVYSYRYSTDGRLTEDEDPTHAIQRLTRAESTSSYSVTDSTPMNRQTTYEVERLSNGNTSQVNTFPTGAQNQTQLKTDVSSATTFADGTTLSSVDGPDPRFGIVIPISKSLSTQTPGGLASYRFTNRQTTLTDSNDPLSLNTLQDTTQYCADSGCTSEVRTYRTTYVANQKRFSLYTPEGRASYVSTDAQGKITAIQPPGVDPMNIQYDAQGRLSQSSLGDQSLTVVYDSLGRVQSTTNAASEASSFSYDAADRMIETVTPLGNTYAFNYDGNSNLTQIQMPGGSVHGLAYNELNLLQSYTPPGSGQPYIWSYNGDRDLISTTLPSGHAIDSSYDAGGRLSAIAYPEASVQLTYNDNTERLSQIRRTPAPSPGDFQTIAFNYDGPLLTRSAWTGVANGTYDYTYGIHQWLSNIKLTSGSDTVSIPLTLDGDGLVTQYGDFSINRFGPNGRPSEIAGNGFTIDYTYDNQGRLTSRTHQFQTGVDDEGDPIYQQIYSLQLTRDNTGRITQRIDTDTYDYSYDSDGELTEVDKDSSQTEQYTYDSNGNRTSTLTATAQYDAQDRITGQGNVSYQHDADGFMVQRGSDTFQYSTRGELLQATVGGTTATYAYDGNGRRVGRSLDSVTWYQYFYGDPRNGYLVTATRDENGNLTTYYYDDFAHLFAFKRGTNWFFVATDQVGTPKIVSDASGTPVKTLVYDSYGVLILDSNPGFDLPIGFAGGINDPVTGLVRLGARDYDPTIGRWISKDPILFSGGQGNLYGYVWNNPVSYTDLSGEAIFLVFFGPVLVKVIAGTLAVTLFASAIAPFYMNTLPVNPCILEKLPKGSQPGTRERGLRGPLMPGETGNQLIQNVMRPPGPLESVEAIEAIGGR